MAESGCSSPIAALSSSSYSTGVGKSAPNPIDAALNRLNRHGTSNVVEGVNNVERVDREGGVKIDHLEMEEKKGAVSVGTGILRCTYPNCERVRLMNDRSHLCQEHSTKSAKKGWRECKYEGCDKCRQGNTQFCKQHGGGRKCLVDGCTKLARGKMYCASHGGGKRCFEAGCIRMAVGPSGKCIGHGGGKRCEFEGCEKAAQYSWTFCARHAAEVRSQVKDNLKDLADLLEKEPVTNIKEARTDL